MVIYSVLHRLLFSHSRVEIANDHKDDLKDVTLLELLLIINISKYMVLLLKYEFR